MTPVFKQKSSGSFVITLHVLDSDTDVMRKKSLNQLMVEGSQALTFFVGDSTLSRLPS